MTSKTPVRSAEDIDATALSYAEIKALATGNPHIIEKCQLELEVNKLSILHSSHLSQKYALEDKILKEYPQEIKRLTKRIAGYKADIETAAHNPVSRPQAQMGPASRWPSMTVGGILYTDKSDANVAIITACKAMASPAPVPLGKYRGLSMIQLREGIPRDTNRRTQSYRQA